MSEAATAAQTPGLGRFHLLDGMRGLAAFAVILDHVPSATLSALTPGRYLAVDFFFVLSGYVLAHAYGGRLANPGGAAAFLRERFARLYPLYLLGLMIALATVAAQRLAGWTSIGWGELATVAALGVLFAPTPPVFGWTTQHLYPVNGPAWSLFFELVANAVYARVARFLTARVFCVLLPVAGAFAAVAILNHEAPGPGWLWPHFGAGFARVMYGFFAGVCLYRMRDRLPRASFPAWAPVLILAAMMMLPVPAELRKVFDATAAIVLAPLAVWMGAGCKITGKAAGFCSWMGRMSYGVYILHVPLMGALGLIFALAGWAPPFGFVHVLLVAALAAAASLAADRIWDRPLRRLLSRVGRSPATRLAPGADG